MGNKYEIRHTRDQKWGSCSYPQVVKGSQQEISNHFSDTKATGISCLSVGDGLEQTELSLRKHFSLNFFLSLFFKKGQSKLNIYPDCTRGHSNMSRDCIEDCIFIRRNTFKCLSHILQTSFSRRLTTSQVHYICVAACTTLHLETFVYSLLWGTCNKLN